MKQFILLKCILVFLILFIFYSCGSGFFDENPTNIPHIVKTHNTTSIGKLMWQYKKYIKGKEGL